MALTKKTHTELNPVQESLLRLFNRPMSLQEAKDLKRVLVGHYTEQLDVELTNIVNEKEYTQSDFDNMLAGQK